MTHQLVLDVETNLYQKTQYILIGSTHLIIVVFMPATMRAICYNRINTSVLYRCCYFHNDDVFKLNNLLAINGHQHIVECQLYGATVLRRVITR